MLSSMDIEQIVCFPHNAKNINITPRGYGKVSCEHFSESNCKRYSNRYCISYVEEGSGWFILNNKKYRIQSGDLFFAPQYIPNIHYADDGTKLKLYWTIFTSDSNMELFTEDPVIHAPTAYGIFFSMCNHTYSIQESPYKTSGYILDLLCLYLEYNKVLENSYQSRNVRLTKYMLAYIETNYAQKCNLSEVAVNLHFDSNYLTKIFRNEVGFTPQQYLTACRIYHGAIMLINHPDITITNIAYEVGYNNISNFRKAFQSYIKMTVYDFKMLSDEDKIKCISQLCADYNFSLPASVEE